MKVPNIAYMVNDVSVYVHGNISNMACTVNHVTDHVCRNITDVPDMLDGKWTACALIFQI